MTRGDDMSQLNFLDELERGIVQPIGPRACVLRGFALACVDDPLSALAEIEQVSPFRHMVTPGGFTMSVALTNCGALGWTTDSRLFCYTRADPESNQPWPTMP